MLHDSGVCFMMVGGCCNGDMYMSGYRHVCVMIGMRICHDGGTCAMIKAYVP